MEKNNYLKGVIAAFIGGLIFGLPWALVYIYAGYIMSLLATLIAFGAYLFYKKSKAKVTKKTSLIIGIISFVVVSLLTFVIIPSWLVLREGHNLNSVVNLYQNNGFVKAIIGDYVVSVIFTFLGIGGVISNINKEAYNVSDKDEISYEDKLKRLEKIYTDYNALDKKNAVPNAVVLNTFKVNNNYMFLKEMIKEGIVLTKGSKTYFDKESINNEERKESNAKKTRVKNKARNGLITLLAIFVAFILILLSYSDEVNYKTYKYNNISISLPDYFEFDKKNSDDELGYFDGFSESYLTGLEAVMLEEFTVDLSSDELKSDFKSTYLEFLKEAVNVSLVEECEIDSIKGSLIMGSYIENTDKKTYIYLLLDENKAYLTELIYDESDEDLFEENYKQVVNSIKINK